MDPKRLGNALMDYTTADVLNQPIRRGAILPWTEYADRSEFDLSSGITGSMGRAITAPARAYRGEMTDDQMINEGANLAGWLTLGGYMSPKQVNALGTSGGRAAGMKAGDLVRLFHGTTDEGLEGMMRTGRIDGPAFFSPTIDGAESYGPNVVTAYVPASDLKIDFDLPNSRLLSVAEANQYLDKPGWSINDWLESGRAVGTEEAFSGKKYAPDGTLFSNGRNSTIPGVLMSEAAKNANPADFLDWDKPLSQQSEKAREAALSAMERASGITRNDLKEGVTGADAVRYGGLDDPNAMTNALREAGIPGIKYLDQMSRGAGEGSSNYVVFDDALIEIMRKYGLLGPVAAGTVAAATNDEGPIY